MVFGARLQQARTAWIEDLSEARNVLILGEGDGRFLEKALEIAPEARFTVVDGSHEMLNTARKRIGTAASRVEFHHQTLPGDLSRICETGPFDAVTTHFFLDCFRDEELKKLVPAVTTLTASEATWLISDFHVPTKRGMKRLFARSVVTTLYFVFRIMSGLRVSKLPDWKTALKAAGWKQEHSHPKEPLLFISDSWQRTKSSPPSTEQSD
ncbi:MAG: class I SAM-dependent methyltransferase [Verrucomicrobiota bacterium]